MCCTENEIPVACDLAALGESGRKAHMERSRRLLAGGKLCWLDDGLRLELDGDPKTWNEAAEWMRDEARCCPFLEFSLTLRAGKSALLTVREPERARGFLRSELRGHGIS